jgi:hypothetical protein
MTVKQAIEELSKLPEDARLMVASLGHGGSVPLQRFHDMDEGKDGVHPHWVDVVYCEDEEREGYGLEKLLEESEGQEL